MPWKKAHVAVIGAGPAGLAVAQQLLREGHSVVVFEAGPAMGGAWHFDSSTDSDPLGLDPQRIKVHSSMYASLRTNLPRALMTYIDFPFTPAAMAGRSNDPRMYPLHTEVLAYLQAFADAFDLHKHIHLNTAVMRIDPVATKSSAAPVTSAAAAAPVTSAAAAAPVTSSSAAAATAGETAGTGAQNMQSCSTAGAAEAHADISTRNSCCSCSSSSSKDPVEHSPQGAARAVFPLAAGQELQWRVVTQRNNSSSSSSSSSRCSRQHSRCTPSVAQEAAATEQTGASMPTPMQQVQVQVQQQRKQEWLFDAVAVCVGIFSEPNLPQVPGMASWRGQQLHSHNYRSAEAFKGQRVMVVGASFSGEEIARAIALHAQQVYHCARTFTGPGTAREPPATAQDGIIISSSSGGTAQQPVLSAEQEQLMQQPSVSIYAGQAHHASMNQQDLKQPLGKAAAAAGLPPAPEPRPNIQQLSMLQQLLPGGAAVLQDGQVLQDVDAVVYCTGYRHTYPWLEHLGLVETSDAHVRPLYQHMFVPAVGPSLSFIGLPWRCAKMPQFQLQAQLLARLLSGRAQLPSQQQMMQEQQRMFDVMAAVGIPRRYTHCMAKFMPQDEWAYADALCRLAAGSQVAEQNQQQRNQQHCGVGGDDSSRCQLGTAGSIPEAARAAVDELQVACCCRTQQGGVACTEQRQQQDGLLVMPWWLKALAAVVAGDILSRPDSFRDSWSDEVEQVMQQADQEMLRLYNPARS